MRTVFTKWRTVFFLVLGIVIAPLIVYWVKFGSLRLSSNFDHWVNFSTYWSPYLVAALTIILAYISWQSLELMKLKEKPLLTLGIEPGERNNPDSSMIYYLKNLGQGPALNIKLFIRIDHPSIGSDPFLLSKGLINKHHLPEQPTDFEYMVHSITLSQNETLRIDWQERICDLIVTYSDVYGTHFSIKANESNIEYSEGDFMKIDNQGKKDGVIWFTDGKNNDPYLGKKRVFVLGEVTQNVIRI